MFKFKHLFNDTKKKGGFYYLFKYCLPISQYTNIILLLVRERIYETHAVLSKPFR